MTSREATSDKSLGRLDSSQMRLETEESELICLQQLSADSAPEGLRSMRGGPGKRSIDGGQGGREGKKARLEVGLRSTEGLGGVGGGEEGVGSRISALKALLESKIGPIKKKATAKSNRVVVKGHQDGNGGGRDRPLHREFAKRGSGREMGKVQVRGRGGFRKYDHGGHIGQRSSGGGHKFATPDRMSFNRERKNSFSPQAKWGSGEVVALKSKEMKEASAKEKAVATQRPSPQISKKVVVQSEGGSEEVQEEEKKDKDRALSDVSRPVKPAKVSSNWLALSQQIKEEKKSKKAGGDAGKKNQQGKDKEGQLPRGGQSQRPGYIIPEDPKTMQIDSPIAMDCEMVGVGKCEDCAFSRARADARAVANVLFAYRMIAHCMCVPSKAHDVNECLPFASKCPARKRTASPSRQLHTAQPITQGLFRST